MVSEVLGSQLIAYCLYGNSVDNPSSILPYLSREDSESLLKVSKAIKEIIVDLKNDGTIPPYLTQYPTENRLAIPLGDLDRKLMACASSRWGNKFAEMTVNSLGNPQVAGSHFIMSAGVDGFVYKLGPDFVYRLCEVQVVEKSGDPEFKWDKKANPGLNLPQVTSIEHTEKAVSVIAEKGDESFSFSAVDRADLSEKYSIPLPRPPSFCFDRHGYAVLLFKRDPGYDIVIYEKDKKIPAKTAAIKSDIEILGGAIFPGAKGECLVVWGDFGLISYDMSTGRIFRVFKEPVTQFVEFEHCCFLLNDKNELFQVASKDGKSGVGCQTATTIEHVDKITKMGSEELLIEAKKEMILITTDLIIKAHGIKDERKSWKSGAACKGGGFLVLGHGNWVKQYKLIERKNKSSEIRLLNSWNIVVPGLIQSLFFLKNGILIGMTDHGVVFNVSPYEYVRNS